MTDQRKPKFPDHKSLNRSGPGSVPTAAPEHRRVGNCCSLLGMSVDEVDFDAVLAHVRRWYAASASRYICLSNVHMVMECYDHPQFRSIVNEADLVTADGVPVKWASRWLGLGKQRRVCGPDLAIKLCEMAAQEGIPVGFYGSTPQVVDALLRNVATRFPTLHVPFRHSPPFRLLTAEEDDRIVRQIDEAGVRILFVGLGCPNQEQWMAAHRGRISATMLGVGYAFDILAGTSTRAPVWLQNIGMEWCFRLVLDPRHLWRRYLKHNPRFLVLVLRQLFQQRLVPGLLGRHARYGATHAPALRTRPSVEPPPDGPSCLSE
jgi:N-acetylglucosaminyldiphosphoundecaprenol N-acetyl-beta-D-mannosaminyltransferase